MWKEIGNKTILIVEDDEFNIFLIQNIFTKNKYIKFIIAKNGLEALQMLKEEKVDLILLDLHMPLYNGWETLEEIRLQKEYDSISIVAISTDENEDKNFIRKGGDGFIAKPFDIEELENQIYTLFLKKSRDITINKIDDISYPIKDIEESQKQFFTKLIMLKTRENSNLRFKLKSIATLSQAFSVKLGFNDENSKNIYYGALVKNIGLIGCCFNSDMDNKLCNEGYKEYIRLSYDMMCSQIETPFIKIAKTIILEHNESYDGEGIPYGISGENISIEATIVSIVVKFENIIEMDFDNKFTNEDIAHTIEKFSDKKFNSKILDIFIENIEIFIKLRKRLYLL